MSTNKSKDEDLGQNSGTSQKRARVGQEEGKVLGRLALGHEIFGDLDCFLQALLFPRAVATSQLHLPRHGGIGHGDGRVTGLKNEAQGGQELLRTQGQSLPSLYGLCDSVNAKKRGQPFPIFILCNCQPQMPS